MRTWRKSHLLHLLRRKDEDKGVYSKKSRQDLVEKGALTSGEEGFMKGYEEALKEEQFIF